MTFYNQIQSESNIAPFAQYLTKTDPVNIQGGWKQVYGFVVSAKNAELVDFTVQEEDKWELIDFPFQTGKTDTIFVSANPRICVLGSSRLYMAEKANRTEYKPYNKDFYQANKDAYHIYTQYGVFFVSQKGLLMHNKPLFIRLKGVVGAQFARYYGVPNPNTSTKIKQNEQMAFCDALKVQAKEFDSKQLTNANYYAEQAFEPVIKSEKKGVGSQSMNMGCIVGWKQRPSLSNKEPGYSVADSEKEKINEFLVKILTKEPGWNMEEYFMPKLQPAQVSPGFENLVGASYSAYAPEDDYESFE